MIKRVKKKNSFQLTNTTGPSFFALYKIQNLKKQPCRFIAEKQYDNRKFQYSAWNTHAYILSIMDTVISLIYCEKIFKTFSQDDNERTKVNASHALISACIDIL